MSSSYILSKYTPQTPSASRLIPPTHSTAAIPKGQPVLTFVARQKGEAWNHPFVCVYEPSSDTEPGDIASVDYFTPSEQGAVGIIVKLKNGTEQRIVCSENGKVSFE